MINMANNRESSGTLNDVNLKRPAHPSHEPMAQKLDFSLFNKKLSAKPVFNSPIVDQEVPLVNDEGEPEEDTSESLKYAFFHSQTTKKVPPVESKVDFPEQKLTIKPPSRQEKISMIKNRFGASPLDSKFTVTSVFVKSEEKAMEIDKVIPKINPSLNPTQKFSTIEEVPSNPSVLSDLSNPSNPSNPSVLSIPSNHSVPSVLSVPSNPSVLSVPSNPSVLSVPSNPSVYSVPSNPSLPSVPSTTQPAQTHQNINQSSKKPSKTSETYTKKYCPTQISELFCNRSQTDKLKNWLNLYSKNSISEWLSSTQKRVALISGPPGVGKTTAARLVPALLELRIIELNASDCRNKSYIQEKILPFVSNTSIISTKIVGKAVLVMDEVDGMSTGDEGGISALIDCIKITKVPIICICNDSYSTGIKSLKPHCIEIKFNKANERDTFRLARKINENEKLNLNEKQLEMISLYSRGDFRFCLNILEFCRSEFFLTGEKDAIVSMNSFEVVQNLMSQFRARKFSLNDKVSMFLEDYDFASMLVVENYVNNVPINDLGNSAENLAFSDTVLTRIRQQQEWTLLPDFANSQLLTMSYSVEDSVMISFPKTTSKPKKNQKKSKKAQKTSEPETSNQGEDLETLLLKELSKLF
jgi:DNA polymerase III delta prime subunit